MKTQEHLKMWRKYWTNSTLFLVVIAVLLIFRAMNSMERDSVQVGNDIERNVVVRINNQVVVSKQTSSDTVNIYLNTYHPDTSVRRVIVDTTATDTLLK